MVLPYSTPSTCGIVRDTTLDPLSPMSFESHSFVTQYVTLLPSLPALNTYELIHPFIPLQWPSQGSLNSAIRPTSYSTIRQPSLPTQDHTARLLFISIEMITGAAHACLRRVITHTPATSKHVWDGHHHANTLPTTRAGKTHACAAPSASPWSRGAR